MKKAFLVFVIHFAIGNLTAQTVLNRFPIELQKSSEFFQITNATNDQNEYFTFISDKEKLTVLKHNSALFFTDSISIERPDRKFDLMAGVTFSADGNPNLYWASKNYETLKMIHFDFELRTTSDLVYTNDFSRKKIIDVFTAQNQCVILSITPENTLKFTTFSNIGKTDNIVSIDSIKSTTSKQKADTLINQILEQGLTVIEPEQFTPLFIATAKIKRYLINKSQYILGFESATGTTLLIVDLKNFSSQLIDFPYENFPSKTGSNSFLHQAILYQVSINATTLSLTGTDIATKNKVGNYAANAKDEIDFKNSPLLLQSDNGNSRELKNTAKLLSKMNLEQVGVSIYTTPYYNLFTIGGVREVPSGGGFALGLGMGIGGIIAGSDFMIDPDAMTTNLQSLYFESFFDPDFKHVKMPFSPLYIDALGEFLNSNQPVIQNLVHYQGYLILNYYDSKTKEFVMRKFEDYKD